MPGQPDSRARRHSSDRPLPDAAGPGDHQHRRAHRSPDYAGGLIGFVLLKTSATPAMSRGLLLRVRAATPCARGLHDAGLLEDGAHLPVEEAAELLLPGVRGLGGRERHDLVRERRRLQRQGVPDRRRDLRRRRRAVRDGDAGRLRAGRDRVPGGRRHLLQAGGIKPTPRSATTSTTTATAWSTTATACATTGFVCSKGVCIRLCDDSEFPCAVGPQLRHRRAVQGSALRRHRLPGGQGVPGAASASAAATASSARSASGASSASASIHARACRARAPCARWAPASAPATAACAPRARRARRAARATATASTPAATR